MTYTERTITDKIEILADGTMQVREAKQVLRDGEVIAQEYHRYCVVPGDALPKQDVRVQSVSQAVWTEDVIQAHRDKMAAIETKMVESK